MTAHVIPRLIRPCIPMLLVGIVSASCGLRDDSDYSLVAGFEPGMEQRSDGLYPDFVDPPRATSAVNIRGDARESLSPPFPSRLRFEVEVPSAGFLEFSPALITNQDVRRARVEFRVSVGEGRGVVELYSEILRAAEANRWHDRELDLAPWAGRVVVLTMDARAVPPRGTPLWADRVQTVWGNPVVGPRPVKALAARAAVNTREALDWLGVQLESSGVSPDQQTLTWTFAVYLFFGGVLSLGARELYRRFARTHSNRDRFANMLPLFTLATITVISVVQTSPALALGLVGALSVIRFRAAIASAEDLAYLLVCVGLGVSIGANHVFLAATTVVVVSPFVLARRRSLGVATDDDLVLTVTADRSSFFGRDGRSVIDDVRRLTREMIVERVDQGSERVLLRARVSINSENQLLELLTTLRPRVHECQLSSLEADPY